MLLIKLIRVDLGQASSPSQGTSFTHMFLESGVQGGRKASSRMKPGAFCRDYFNGPPCLNISYPEDGQVVA